MPFHFEQRDQQLCLSGDLTIYEVEAFQQQCTSWPAETDAPLNCNLAEIQHIDTAGLQLLLMWQHFKQVQLSAPSAAVLEAQQYYQLPLQFIDECLQNT